MLISSSAGLALVAPHSAQAQAPATPGGAPRSATSPANLAAARIALSRAQQLDKQGISSLAAVQFRAATEAAPQSVEMARALAGFYSRQQRWEEASEAWRQVLLLKRGAGDAQASAQLARAQSALLRNSDALPTRRSSAASQDAQAAASQNELTSTRGSAQTLPPTAPTTSPLDPSAVPPSVSAPTDLGAAPTPDVNTAPTPDLSAPIASPAPQIAPIAPVAPEIVPQSPAMTALPDAPAVAPLPAPAPDPAPAAPPRLVPRRTPQAPLQAPVRPVVASTNVSAIPFVNPPKTSVRVAAKKRAAAWPLVNRAARELSANRPSSALRLYEQAAQIDPTNAYATPGVATSYIVLGRFADAASAYRRYLAIKPNDPTALRGLGDALTYSGKYREALGVNNAILAKTPTDFAAAYQNAQVATYLGSYAQSDRFFNIALGKQPQNAEVLAAAGESLAYRRDPRAVARFQKALSIDDRSVRALTGLGDYYSYVGQFGLAIPRYRAALAASKPNAAGNLKTQLALADALTYSGQFDASTPLYNAVLAKQPTNRTTRLGLGRALVYAGKSERGAAELRRVLAVEPRNAPALEALALAQSDFAPVAAISTYQKVLANQTTPAARAKTLASIGDLRARNDQFPLAIGSYSQAARLAPSDPKIGLSYAQLLASQEQFAEARPVVESVLSRSPRNPQALALQVLIENRTGNTARAQELSSGLETVPFADADEALALAEALRATGNSVAANRILLRAASTVNDPETALRVADATRNAGDYATSAALYNRILTSNPANIPARLSLAEALFYQKDTAGAQAQVNRILAVDPGNQEASILAGDIAHSLNTPEGDAEAQRRATAVLAANPNNAAALVLSGDLLTSRQQFAGAVAQYRSALAAKPGNLEARLGLARNLNYSRDVEGSIAEYRELIRRLPIDTLPRLELAQIYLDRNRFSDAEALYNEVLALRRGLPLSATARWSVETRASAKLSPKAITNSMRPTRMRSFKASHRVVVDAPGRVVATNAPAKRRGARVILTQTIVPGTGTIASAAASGAGTLPSTSASAPGTSAGTASSGTATNDVAPTTSTAPSPPPISPLPTSPSATLSAPTVPDLGTPTAPLAPSTRLPASGTAGAATPTPLSDQGAALRGLGEIRRRQNRFSESLDFYNQAASLDPTDLAAQLGVAQALRGQSKFADALAQTDRVVASDATNLPARVLRAQLLGDAGQNAQAQQELDALVASLPDATALDTYVTLVNAFNTLQNYPASLGLLNDAIRDFPLEPALPRLRAETLTFAKRNDEAIAIYDTLIAADPQDADAVLGKARVYNYSDQLPLAEATYRQALEIQPTNYQATTELADVLGRRGNYPASIALYQNAIGLNPTDLATRVELARVQRFAGNPADAEVTLNQVLEADPRSVPALTERGVLRGTQGSYGPAIADLNAALEVSPTDIDAQLGLAEVQSYAGDYPSSIAGFRAILTRDPQNIRARTALGSALSYSGQTDAALKELNTVLAANPTNSDARIAKAGVLARAPRTAEAVQLYEAILVADPQNVRARTGLADAYLLGRQYSDAVSVYDALLAVDPTNTSYRIQRARALGYGGKSREAVASLRAVVAADPTNLTARLALAEAGTNSGNGALLGDAIAEYRQILTSDPTNVSAQIGLGRALSYRGKYGESTRILNAVLKANPGNVEAGYALAETQRFAGNSFGAATTYSNVLTTQPANAQAAAGLRSVRRVISPLVTLGGTYYSDTNGVRLRSFNYGGTLPTRAGTIGVIAERGKFSQNGSERNRNALSLLLARAFGPVQARLVLTRLRYDGAPNRTLFDLLFSTSRGPRQRYFLGAAKRDIFESDAAVARGITATLYRAGLTYPVGNHIDLEGQVTRYRYSDSNNRTSVQPSIFYRFRPTNPTLRVGLGYFYDNTSELRNGPPFLYYTPQGFNATSLLADYVYDAGDTRYSLSGAYPLTGETGDDGLNRPAKTLFGSVSHFFTESLELFADGGIVRAPSFRSNQISGGVNLRF